MFSGKKGISLALGSGGAKGLAHIGALKALEECGLRFCAVAGTSIGSIVGALYATGYSPTDIAELLRRFDLKSMALSVLAAGTVAPVRDALDSMLDENVFSELRLPFAAVATDADSGEEVVLRSGKVADAVLASSAMPPFFKGIRLDDRLLCDGAFTNAVPGDVARALGGHFVIGISLSPAENYACTRFLARSGKEIECRQRGIKSCDFMLEPDLSQFSATDITSAAVMYDIGYECAHSRAGELLDALRAHHIKI